GLGERGGQFAGHGVRGGLQQPGPGDLRDDVVPGGERVRQVDLGEDRRGVLLVPGRLQAQTECRRPQAQQAGLLVRGQRGRLLVEPDEGGVGGGQGGGPCRGLAVAPPVGGGGGGVAPPARVGVGCGAPRVPGVVVGGVPRLPLVVGAVRRRGLCRGEQGAGAGEGGVARQTGVLVEARGLLVEGGGFGVLVPVAGPGRLFV